MFNSSKLKTFPISYSDAWCAAFISAMAIESGCTDIIPISANCNEMYEKGVTMGIAIPKSKWFPKMGDIIFYDPNLNGELDHVGVVETMSKNTIHVLEGNKNDSVAYRDIYYKNATITSQIPPISPTNGIPILSPPIAIQIAIIVVIKTKKLPQPKCETLPLSHSPQCGHFLVYLAIILPQYGHFFP